MNGKTNRREHFKGDNEWQNQATIIEIICKVSEVFVSHILFSKYFP